MLLGARPGVATKAAAKLKEIAPVHSFEVLHHGYFKPEEEPGLILRLSERRPDLLLVAFGSPRQEVWIARHATGQRCTVAAGVGALFDFLAGEIPRAPVWLRAARMEWIYRLCQEPSRLWRRYLVGNLRFLTCILTRKIKQLPRHLVPELTAAAPREPNNALELSHFADRNERGVSPGDLPPGSVADRNPADLSGIGQKH
jgi:exopolysaccharide biosynthesis WecB/TagA/CpsF family protein